MTETGRHMVARCPDCKRITAASAHFDKTDKHDRKFASDCAKRGDMIEYHDGEQAIDAIRKEEWGCKCDEIRQQAEAVANPALPGME